MMADSFEEVAAGTFAYAHEWAEGKCAVVCGDTSALVIDSGGAIADGEAMAAFLRDRGFEPRRLLLTHGHGHHVWGAQPLAQGEVYAHDFTPAVMRRQLPAWAEKWGVSEVAAAARLPWPTTTFAQPIRFHLGGRTVRTVLTPGHSEDGISAYIEEERVLIGGDAVVTSIVPALAEGSGRVLETSLRVLLTLEIDALVPGHGDPVLGRNAVHEALRWEADYLYRVRLRVRELLGADTKPEHVLEFVTYEEFVGARLAKEHLNMESRHRATVSRICADERTRLPDRAR